MIDSLARFIVMVFILPWLAGCGVFLVALTLAAANQIAKATLP